MGSLAGHGKVQIQCGRHGPRSCHFGSGSRRGLRERAELRGSGRCTAVSRTAFYEFFVAAFNHQRRVLFEGYVADPLQTISAIPPGSRLLFLLTRTVMQDGMSEVWNVYPQLIPRVFDLLAFGS